MLLDSSPVSLTDFVFNLFNIGSHCDRGFQTKQWHVHVQYRGLFVFQWLQLRTKSSSGAQWRSLGLFRNPPAFNANETLSVWTTAHATTFQSVPVTTIIVSIILHIFTYWPYDLVCVYMYICMFSRNLMSSTPFCIYTF